MMFAHNPLAPVVAGDRPSLSLDFTRAATLKQAVLRGDPSITFIRSTTGTYFDANGIMRTAAVDEPRFDHDPLTKARLGLRIENATTNLLLQSEDFGTTWAATGGTPIITVDNAAAPDGAMTADLLGDDDAAAAEEFGQSVTVTDDSMTKVYSLYLKGNTSLTPVMRMRYSVGTTPVEAAVKFDLSAKTFVNSGASVVILQEMLNGWFRCSMALANNATGNTDLSCRILPASDETLAVGSMGTVWAWGAQLQGGYFPTSYVPTTTLQFARTADVVTITPLGAWYNLAAGTMIIEFINIPADDESEHRLWAYFAGSDNNNRLEMGLDFIGANDLFIKPRNAGVGAFFAAGAINTFGAIKRAALRYDNAVGNVSAALDGGGISSLAFTMPGGINRVNIGNFRGSSRFLDSTIRKVSYWPRGLEDSLMQAPLP